MLDIIRSNSIYWQVNDTEFAKPPKELQGFYTDKVTAEKAVHLFKQKMALKAKVSKKNKPKIIKAKAEEIVLSNEDFDKFVDKLEEVDA